MRIYFTVVFFTIYLQFTLIKTAISESLYRINCFWLLSEKITKNKFLIENFALFYLLIPAKLFPQIWLKCYSFLPVELIPRIIISFDDSDRKFFALFQYIENTSIYYCRNKIPPEKNEYLFLAIFVAIIYKNNVFKLRKKF